MKMYKNDNNPSFEFEAQGFIFWPKIQILMEIHTLDSVQVLPKYSIVKKMRAPTAMAAQVIGRIQGSKSCMEASPSTQSRYMIVVIF